MLPDDLDLRLHARLRAVSIADLTREALERYLPTPGSGGLQFFAIGEGGAPDVSERVDEYLARALTDRDQAAAGGSR